MTDAESDAVIEIDKMSVDQFAGAVVLILGAIGSLLLVVWQSKCHCRVNLCYIFQCERRPPNEEELKTLAEEAKGLKDKQNKMNKKEDKILDKENQILEEVEEQRTPRLIPKTKPEPEPEPEIDKLV
jgi:hypothetical protein